MPPDLLVPVDHDPFIDLPDIGQAPIPDGGQFSPGTRVGNLAADLASRFGAGAVKAIATLPQRAIDASARDVQHLGDSGA